MARRGRSMTRKVGGRRRVRRSGKIRVRSGSKTMMGARRKHYRRRGQRGSGLGSMFGSLLGKVGGLTGAMNGLGALANLGSGLGGMIVAGKQGSAIDEERQRAKQMHDIALRNMGY